jgi:hypothetical protein
LDRPHGIDRFWTTPPVDDVKAGCTTLRLHRESRESPGNTVVAAEIVFWDAAGQYFLQTFNGDVPLTIIEALIAEAKEKIKYK